VMRVSKTGGPFARWHRYAQVLKTYGEDMDIVYAFSSVSVGMPLRFARLKHPKKVLRLGGDFLWERYTDRGGRRSLRAFYQFYRATRPVMKKLLSHFDAIVFSTTFQARLMEYFFRGLPLHVVIENALPVNTNPKLHVRHEPLRLLYLGRFVRFKNLPSLLRAVARLPYVRLTLVGSGPAEDHLKELAIKLSLSGRVTFMPPVHGEKKSQVLQEHDVLVMPSITEISPHSAIEARAAGLPVLLTEDTGLSSVFNEEMILRPLQSAEEVTRAILEIERNYEKIAEDAAREFSRHRTWEELTEETLRLLEHLHSGSSQ